MVSALNDLAPLSATYLKVCRPSFSREINMAERFKEADERIFKDVYICRRCNARNKVHDPEDAKCRKCGYDGLRHKNKEFASE